MMATTGIAGSARAEDAPPAPAAAPAEKALKAAETKAAEPEQEAEEDEEAESEDDERLRPSVTVHGKSAKLHLESTPPGLTFYRQTAAAVASGPGRRAFANGYDRLCTAPCDVSTPAGTEQLALGREDDPPRVAEPVTFGPGKSTLRGHFESRSGYRSFGWVLAIGSAIGGGYLIYDSLESGGKCVEDACYSNQPNTGELAAGLLVVGVGVGVGVIGFATMLDKAHVTVATRSLPSARGITVNGTF